MIRTPVWIDGRRRGTALALALALAGCGIDQGGIEGPVLPGSTGGPGGATAQTTLVAGPITGFGSVHVNRLTLYTDTAQILVDGRFATEAELAVGHIIRAVAVPADGGLRALSIEHEANLAGPIDALDAAAGTLSVLGQTVVVDGGTTLGGSLTAASELARGASIVVSGLTSPTGEIRATSLRRARAGEGLQITARITTHDPANLTFGIGGLTIDYSQALLLQLPSGAPELGLVVEVRGTTLADGVLLGTQVRARPSLPGQFTAAATSLTDFETPLVGAASGSAMIVASFVGFITGANLPTTISLVDIDVAIDASTLIAGGTIADLGVGAKVQVEGHVIGFGQIRASRIEVL